jgi:type IV pilus assembly protein PilN
MTRINLLPVKDAQIANQRRQQISLVILGACLVALLMVVPYVLQKRAISRLDNEMEDLRVEVAKYEELTKEAKGLDKRRKELQTKLDVIQDLDRKRIGPTRVLSDLSDSVPEKLWVEDFAETGGVANIVGWALDNQTVASFMRQLEASDYFNNVDLTEATQPEGTEQIKSFASETGTVRFKRFVIKATINYFGKAGATVSADKDQDTKPGEPQKQAQQASTRAQS